MLELGVLLAQLPELTQFAQTQSRILLLPDVVRRLADPVCGELLISPESAIRHTQEEGHHAFCACFSPLLIGEFSDR
jgi:hypothetical protein